MVKFEIADKDKIKLLASIADEIWHEYWPFLLSKEQIDYMVEIFQSEAAIKKQIDFENYNYYFIKNDDETAGYFGISFKEDYLFLSKLYIKKDYRHKGIGKKAFLKLKDIAKEKKYKKIRLTVNKNNKNTINAYLKYGLKIAYEDITDIGHGFVMDDYIMDYAL